MSNNFETHVKALQELMRTRHELIKAADRKRTMRESERAMTKALYRTQIAALEKSIELMTALQQTA